METVLLSQCPMRRQPSPLMGHGSISTPAPISASPDGLRIGFLTPWSSGRGTGKTRGAARSPTVLLRRFPKLQWGDWSRRP